MLLINLPIGIAAALDRARGGRRSPSRAAAAGGFDLAGALTVTGGLLALVYGIVNAGPHGWGSPAAFGPIALGLTLLGAFVLIEGRFATAPLVPLRVFSNRLLRVSNIVVVVFSAALFPMWYFCSLYLQDVLHFGPLDAGLAFLPMALTIMACATQAGGLVARFGAGPVLASGLGLMAARACPVRARSPSTAATSRTSCSRACSRPSASGSRSCPRRSPRPPPQRRARPASHPA